MTHGQPRRTGKATAPATDSSPGRTLDPATGRRLSALCLLIGALALQAVATAGPVKVRLATLSPRDTSFHKSLLSMGEKWRQASGGQVSLTVYPDGTMGSEADMVRRMRVGQLHAAMLTVAGLSHIEESVRALQLLPMVFHSLEEYDHVLEVIRPGLDRRFEEKGFVVLFWGDAGWVRFFSREEAASPEEYRKMKVFVWAGDPSTQAVMRAAGFQAVPLEFTDTLTGLQTGLIGAVPSVPFYALAGQFYGPAPHMLAIDWVPLVGAAVITRKAWNAMPDAARDAIRRAAEETGAQVRQRARAESDESVDAMVKRGLKVQPMTPELLPGWRRLAEALYPEIRNSMADPGLIDEILKALAEHRAKQ
ncbi:MAG: TRAP transporter substrate-binding protein DctP [Lentisphaeria bacterium]|nr:TRAP transporter substrate-binding protein DctP [Lentisphaeria bacterium]